MNKDGLDDWEPPFEKLITKIFKKATDGAIDRDTTLWRGKVLSNALIEGYGKSFADIDYDTPDWLMLEQLQANIWVFSAAADWQMNKDVNKVLVDEKGKLRTFSDFKNEANKIGKMYNSQRLYVEYNHAIATSQMAARWTDYTQNADIFPNLKYQTVGDNRVRQDHKALNGIIKPINDSFWDVYYPPNGWGCRCDVQQTDEGETKESKHTLPEVPKMFATNLAKKGVVYPSGHPYFMFEEYEEELALVKEARKVYEKYSRDGVRNWAKEKYPKPKHFNVPHLNIPVRVSYQDIRIISGKPHNNKPLRNHLLYDVETIFKKMEYVGEAKDFKTNTKHKGTYRDWRYYKLEIKGEMFYINIGIRHNNLADFHDIKDVIRK